MGASAFYPESAQNRLPLKKYGRSAKIFLQLFATNYEYVIRGTDSALGPLSSHHFKGKKL